MMLPDHYKYICNTFECLNDQDDEWIGYLNYVSTSNLVVSNWKGEFQIKHAFDFCVFVSIPSEALAKEILECIKDTEILFV